MGNHVWKFFRAGGFDQVKLETGADMLNLADLDQKLWVALACPTTGLQFDSRTLSMIDTDKDGRIRAPELIAAIKWAGALLKNPDDMARRLSPLPLASINEATPEGARILGSARQILTNLGKPREAAISVEDTVDTGKILAQTAFNGDGVIVEASAADEETRAVIRDIIACLGAEIDRSGKPGVSQAKVDLFFAEAAAFSAWWQKAETDTSLLPAGNGTEAAAAAVKAVKAKLDDFFARCRLAAFDSRALQAVNREEKEFLALAARDLTVTSSEIAAFPLARIEAGRSLPLSEGINPAWAGALATLSQAAVTPILGARTALSEADWTTLQGKVAGYAAWSASKAGVSVEKLGIARIRALLSGKAKETITALIAKDKAEDANVSSIAMVEQLTRFVRDLHLLCTNFVNFKDFYQSVTPAIFQAGTLYLDQRSCELTMRVEDAAKHATMAGLAGAYLAYCDCVRKGTGEKLSIVAVFSQGDDDNLMVGRNGLFYDRRGVDWDATITKIVANPISLRQAFWLPYKKFVRFIEEQVAKRASAAEAASTTKLQGAATKVAEADKTAVPAAKPEAKKIDVGTVAALGVAFGALGAFAAEVWKQVTGLASMGPMGLVWAFLGVILLISGPSLILAYIKLRKRNLGPILDANGWAINARAKISVPFGAKLTEAAKLPPGAQRDLIDPYAEKKSWWPRIIILLFVLWVVYWFLDRQGYIDRWTGKETPVPTVIVPVSTNSPVVN
jgi:hypothetical protein